MTALPPPTSGTLPLLRSSCPTRELLVLDTRVRKKLKTQQEEENLFLRPPPSFYKPREPPFPRTTGRLRPHPGRRARQHLLGEILCLCLKLVRGQSLQTEPLSGAARKGSPRPPPNPSRLGQRPPRQQKPPSHGSCEVVVKWWSPCVRPETPDHFQASPGFLGEKEPKAGFGGFASAPRPSPRPLEPRRSPHPAFRDLCQGGSGDPDGSLPAPLARSTLARLLLLSFLPRTLSQEIAQASCCRSFKGPEPGARTHPRVRAPLPLSLGSLCPLLRSPPFSLRPHRACGPAGGALGRPRGAQQLPQPDAEAARRNAPSRRRRC